jgi:allantoinase
VHSGIDDFPNATESDLRRGMPLIARAGLPLLVHCELTNQQSSDIQHPTSYREYLSSRPRHWEHDAITLMIRLCREYNCRTHIVHLASADAVPMLSAARSSGLPLTVETCPHYLFFSAENIPDGDTRFKCAPPIRENENRERLWDALREKVIDGIVSDHSPAPPELKHLDAGDFTKAWGGISSLQIGLSIIWTEARKRGYHYSDIARWMSWFPAQLAGLTGRKGAIAEGYDADIVVWNPEVSYTLTRERILHRHKVTPYEGSVLYGVVEKTFVRGRAVYDNGLLSDTPHGVIVTK